MRSIPPLPPPPPPPPRPELSVVASRRISAGEVVLVVPPSLHFASTEMKTGRSPYKDNPVSE